MDGQVDPTITVAGIRAVGSSHRQLGGLPASWAQRWLFLLRSTPGALRSDRLDERPASLPGELFVHGGRQPSHFTAVLFEPQGPRLMEPTSPEAMEELVATGYPIWLRVMGLYDTARIEAMLAPLAVPEPLLPPVLDVPQRPRVDCLDEALLVVLHRLSFARDPLHLLSSQVGFLLMPQRLITFEEATFDEAFPLLSRWIQQNAPCGNAHDLDDILHYLVDELLDAIFPMLEQISSRLDSLEEWVLRDPRPRQLSRVFAHRSNLRTIRSQVWPLRHQIRVLLRQNQRLLGPEALSGFRDMAELVELLFDSSELLRSQCDAITQAYAASVGNRMNQVMKTLTIVTSIFAPLTLIAGIYGMNFDHMPELHWRYGYALVLLVMLLVAAVQAWLLWRRGWFGDWTATR